jgi:FkbM family methyltransferase
MPLMENAGKMMPAWGRGLAKWLIRPDYRVERRELSRLKSFPRYRPAVTNILGTPIELVDSASFIFMYKEIFQQQIYRFPADNDRPYIIDCGSNIGLSVLYFKRLFPHSRILAFEPDNDIFDVLKRNVEHTGCKDVELQCRAIWTSETDLHFMNEGADGGRLSGPGDQKSKLVRTVRLRDYLTTPVDFLKLDIEGAETEVLIDCADLLANVKMLFVEFHSFAERPQTLHTLMTVLADAGYRVHIHPPVTSPQPFMRRDVYGGMDMQLNVFCFRT